MRSVTLGVLLSFCLSGAALGKDDEDGEEEPAKAKPALPNFYLDIENHLLDAARRFALHRIQYASVAIEADEPFLAANPDLAVQPEPLGRPALDRRCQ